MAPSRQVARQLVQQMVDMAIQTYSASGGEMRVEGGEIRVRTTEGATIQVVMTPLELDPGTQSAVQGDWAATVNITESNGQQRQFSVPTDWVSSPPA